MHNRERCIVRIKDTEALRTVWGFKEGVRGPVTAAPSLWRAWANRTTTKGERK